MCTHITPAEFKAPVPAPSGSLFQVTKVLACAIWSRTWTDGRCRTTGVICGPFSQVGPRIKQ